MCRWRPFYRSICSAHVRGAATGRVVKWRRVVSNFTGHHNSYFNSTKSSRSISEQYIILFIEMKMVFRCSCGCSLSWPAVASIIYFVYITYPDTLDGRYESNVNSVRYYQWLSLSGLQTSTT